MRAKGFYANLPLTTLMVGRPSHPLFPTRSSSRNRQGCPRHPAPRNGGMPLPLYKDEQGGASVWLETQSIQADARDHNSACGSSRVLPPLVICAVEAHYEIASSPSNPGITLAASPSSRAIAWSSRRRASILQRTSRKPSSVPSFDPPVRSQEERRSSWFARRCR